MQVLHDEEHGLLRGDAQQDRQEGLERFCFCCGREGGGIVGAQRQGEEGGKEGHGLRQRQAVLQEALQFAQLLRRELLPLEAQYHPL